MESESTSDLIPKPNLDLGTDHADRNKSKAKLVRSHERSIHRDVRVRTNPTIPSGQARGGRASIGES